MMDHRQVTLAYRELTELPSDAIRTLCKVEHLDLSHNLLSLLSTVPFHLVQMQNILLLNSPATTLTVRLNGQLLKNIDSLTSLNKLKVLILDNNQLDSQVHFPKLPSVRTLWVNNNKISDLSVFIKSVAKSFSNLQQLSVMFNPATSNITDDGECQDYRHYIVSRLPHLVYLDGRPVTSLEKETARGIYGVKDNSDAHKNTKLDFEMLERMPNNTDNAQAVIYKGDLYVGGGTTPDSCLIFVYQFEPKMWHSSETPTRFYALAVYRGQLVLAGGRLPTSMPNWGSVTDQVWTTDNIQQPFVNTMPSLNISTCAATAIATDEHLIVAGGYDGRNKLRTIQVCSGKEWALLTPLPFPASHIKYACHNNILYLIGGSSKAKVFYVSMSELVSTKETTKSTVWSTLEEAPSECSTITTLNSDIIVIQGKPKSRTLHTYSRATRSWVRINTDFPKPLHITFSLSLTPHTRDKVVIGGSEDDGSSADVYIMSLKWTT